jgi:hypothetical protein
MRPRPARLAALSLAPLSLAAVVVTAAFWLRPRPPDPSGWDEAQLAAELEGLGYHVHAEPLDRAGAPLPNGVPRLVQAGLYVSRDEPADWEEVASRPRAEARGWRGCAVAWQGGTGGRPPDYLVAPPWVFFGDPAELDRIAGALGVPR